MNRNYDENLLLGYVENDLSDKDRAAVEQWMADDPRLASLLKAMAADRDAVRDLPEPTPPEWVMDDVDRGLERTMLLDASTADVSAMDVEQKHTVRRIFAGLAAVASVLLAAGVVIWSVTGPNRERVTFTNGSGEVAMEQSTTEPADDVEEDTSVALQGAKEAEQPTAADALAGEPTASKVAAADADAAEVATGGATATEEKAAVGNTTFALSEQAWNEAEDDDGLVIVLQTRDVNRSIDQLNDVVLNINQATVEPLDDVSGRLLLARANQMPRADKMKQAIADGVADETTGDRAKLDFSASKSMPGKRADEVDDAPAEAAPATAEAPEGQQRATAGQPMRQAAEQRDAVEAEAAQAEPPMAVVPGEQQTQTLTQAAQQAAPNQAMDAQADPARRQEAPPAPSRQRLTYNLIVPADQVDIAVQMLRQADAAPADLDPAVAYQQVQLNSYREARGNVPDYVLDNAQRYANARRNWPRRAPDYADILRQQLPLDEAAPTDQVVIPVIIETQPEDAAN